MSATKAGIIWLSLFLVGFIGQLATGIPMPSEDGVVMVRVASVALVMAASGLSFLGATILAALLGCTQPFMRTLARVFR